MRRHLPSPTIRLRLTLVYGLVFLLTGALLLTIGYALVRHNLDERPNFPAELRRLGFSAPPGSPFKPGVPLFRPGSPEVRVAEALRAQLRSSALHRLLVEYVLALAAMTAISVLAGWLLAGRALRPLREITSAARRVSAQNLGERIALGGPADELKELADTFDEMLARLDATFDSQRHFVASASHELRTPLAIMRAEIDVALSEPASISELRAMGETVRETVDRCERLIESLLTLARSEAAGAGGAVVELSELVAGCVTDLRAQARDSGVELSAEVQPAWTIGDERLLERLIANLLDNGIRHNRPGGKLHLELRSGGGKVVLGVSNGGPTIDPKLAAQLTEPFRRLHRDRGGFGLGLSIVRSVAEAHGGKLELHAPPPGGLEVRVTLPAAVVPTAPARAQVLTQS